MVTHRFLPALTAAVLLAAPAQAYPQWLPVSTDGSAIDFNSVKANGAIRTVTFSSPIRGGVGAAPVHVSCSRWMFNFPEFMAAWESIGRGSAIEVVAFAICPGDRQQHTLQTLKRLVRPTPAPDPVPVPADRTFATDTVRLGDTVASIAARNNTSMKKLLQLNPGLSTARMSVGDTIRLPEPAARSW